jgi:hypothetical protein
LISQSRGLGDVYKRQSGTCAKTASTHRKRKRKKSLIK